MKKKVVALVIDTDLTNEDIEQSVYGVWLYTYKDTTIGKASEFCHRARNIRVLDSDEAEPTLDEIFSEHRANDVRRQRAIKEAKQRIDMFGLSRRGLVNALVGALDQLDYVKEQNR